MIVRCIRNTLHEIPEELRTPEVVRSFGTLTRHYLTKGKAYVVYAWSASASGRWLYVADDVYSSYPVAYAGVLFEVIDDRPSRYWRHGPVGLGDGEAFEAWIADGTFYERLVDGDPDAIRIFGEMKERMDLERAAPGMAAGIAIDVGVGWRMCPACDEAWDAGDEPGTGAMCRCPRCGRVLMRPGEDAGA